MAITITTAICNSWKKEIMQGLHYMKATSGHTFKMALIRSSTAQAGSITYDATTTNYSVVTGNSDEATDSTYTTGGYVAGGFTMITNQDPVITNAVAHISWATNPNWGTAATITSYGCLLYNSTDTTSLGGSAGRAIAVFGFGSDKSCTTGTFTITLPAAGETTSLLRIGVA